MKFISSSFLGNFTFLLGALLLATMGVVLYSAISVARDATEHAQVAQDIVTTLDELTEQVVRSQSDQRAFLLTDDDSFSKARDGDHVRLLNAIALLRPMMAADAGQLRDIDKVNALLVARYNRYVAHSEDRRISGLPAVVGRLEGAGTRSAEIDTLIESLRQHAVTQLERRMAEQRAQRSFALKALLLTSAIGLLVLLPAYGGFYVQSRARDRSENKLRLINARLPGVLYQARRSLQGKISVTYVSGFNPGRSLTAAEMPDWQSLEARIDVRDHPHFRAELARALESLQMFRCDYRMPQSDGGEKWMHNEASLERQPDGSILLNGYVTDVTELKQMQAAVDQAQDEADVSNRSKEAAEQIALAKSAFLATMSHEIRTPMNGVIGMTSLLLETPLTKEQREFTEVIRQSGEGLLVVINDILDYSKIEAGHMELEWQPFDLQEAMESSIELLSLKAQEKKLDVIYLVDPAVPAWVCGDLTRLRQVLVNLIANALKFTERGEIFVSVRQTGAQGEPPPPGTSLRLEVCVQDTGIGIPRDRLDRLFQAFSQVDSSTARRFGGTGLGLAISRRLVEAMGGRLWVESETGVGSRFFFDFTTEAATPVASALRGEHDGLRGKRALLVDDNSTNLRILGLQVHGWGMIPRASASAQQALAWIADGEPFDVVITDMHMDEMDGVQFARRLQAIRVGLPIVLLSSGSVRQTQDAALFDSVLSKPARQLALRNAVVDALTAARPVPRTPAGESSPFDPTLALRNPLRILLAEDNEVNRQVALRMLKAFGYQADVAGNGIEAVTALRRQPYDLVLMDIQMPEMDGLEATRRIVRDFSPGSRPRVVAMSANAMREDMDVAVLAGVDDYVVKPFSAHVLRAALERSGVAQGLRNQPPSAAQGQGNGGPRAALDDRMLREFLAIDPSGEFLGRLITSFTTNSREALAELSRALAQEHCDAVQSAAHQLVGMTSNLGLEEIARLGRKIDALARDGVVDGCELLLAGCERELERGLLALREFLRAHQQARV
jgi:signal transduction histidine kinase/DNA-binding response OmpR family regulator/HPt (histidine-containing phosphotransfer) domain-containing protein